MSTAPNEPRVAKTQRGKRHLEERAPKLVENTKSHLFMHNTTSNQRLKDIFTDLTSITKPFGKHFTQKKELQPFDDMNDVEYITKKNDSSLFAVASHNKKRPLNMVLGRMFNFQLLDMVELGVTESKLMSDFKGVELPMFGSKACLAFHGDLFETNPDFKKLKSLLVDFFRGPVVPNINLSGLDRLMSFTAHEDKIYLRHYRINLKRSGLRTPIVDLAEIGPSLDLVMRRSRFASADLAKSAAKLPKQLKTKKVKNVTHNDVGETLGRLHMEKQELGTLQTRKIKGLKKREAPAPLRADGSKNDGGRKKPRLESSKKGRRAAAAAGADFADDDD